MKYVIVRWDGLYIFDENIEKIEKIDISFNEEELFELYNNKLPEKIKQYLKEDYIFLGQKFEGYKFELDANKIRKALELIQKDIDQSIVVDLTRKKISQSVGRDQLIIQAIMLYDDLIKIINLMMERFREWYELYFPEISQRIEDHEKFLKVIVGKKREELMEEYKIEKTMGGNFREDDINMIYAVAKEIERLYKLREEIRGYIEKIMMEVAPNLSKVATPIIGARLIALAGGLSNLATLPSSTVQVLGAEKALFRHLTKKTPPPKHGVIFNHPYIQKLPKKKRGAMARTLASKILIAAKVDAFGGKYIADKLAEELEKRFNELKNG